jgi:integrase
MALFHELSLVTGWRTNDVCALTFDSIDFGTGRAEIIVQKQSKAAQSRAFSKFIETQRTARKAAAMMAGNFQEYMRLDAATRDDLAAELTQEQIEQAAAAVQAAKLKTDSKTLPDHLIAKLRNLRERNHFDVFIFSRRLCASNRARGQEGHITRQSVWRWYSAVFEALKDTIQNASRLSSYSTRKTFACAILRAAGGDVATVMAMFGHSSIQMSLRYLGLDDAGERAHKTMVSQMELAA